MKVFFSTRITLGVLLILAVSTRGGQNVNPEDIEDNDFAEFEDFEEEGGKAASKVQADQTSESPPKNSDAYETDEDSIVEDEDSEFEHFQDEEEFEGFDGEKVTVGPKADEKDVPKITIANVPLHFRSNWDSYYLELLMIAGLVVYFINVFTGIAKNQKMASVWYSTHRSLLEENFSLVGDDGKIEIESRGLIKESEHLYTLWCSGRTCCEGMLVELRFLKRQDLVSVIAQMMKPSMDQVHIKVDMNKDDMDTFVFCVAAKKTALRLAKDMQDLSVYCIEKKGGEKHAIPSQFQIVSEMGEVSSAMLDSKVTAFFNRYPDLIDFIHFSDQFSGPKQTEETNMTTLPKTKKVLIFGFNIPTKGKTIPEAMEALKPVMNMVFYCMEKVKRYRLSKEGKNKADKNRLKVEEAFLKTTHAARAEAAAARREHKRRQEKERILQEDDPEKQRKWEEKEMKRQMKKKAPKMKQLKVKAL